ncbi:MAG TPA: DUF4399 domain-containing protein [Polyangiales bacterium]|nr:DUF4399 domain-containing protein [Polyangiales bacterium]
MNTTLIQMCLVAVVLTACSQKPAEPPTEPAPAPAAAPVQTTPAAAPTPPVLELPAIPEGAKVMFIEPTDGAKLTGPLENGKIAVNVKMGAEGITVKPAGAVEAGSGHHHIIVDAEPDPEGKVVAKDEQHIHYGQGQTEATLMLSPGDHTLQLQFADGIHRSYGPKLSNTVKISVAETSTATAAADTKAPKAGATKKSAKH